MGERMQPRRGTAIDEAPVDWHGRAGWETVAAETHGWSLGDWERLRAACQVHGLAPRLAAQFGPPPQPSLASFHGWLTVCRRLNRQRAALLRSRLREVLTACDEAGLEVLVLKGSALLGQFGFATELRPTADLDLLVRPSAQPRLDQLLTRLGYRLAALQVRQHHRYEHTDDKPVACQLGEHPRLPLCLELHDRVEVRRATLLEVDLTARLWAGSERAEVAGATALRPATGALFEHLLLHPPGRRSVSAIRPGESNSWRGRGRRRRASG